MPKFAVYSGYHMNRETFTTFTSGLPGADDLFYHSKKRRNFDHWSLEKEFITYVFLPFRSVEYKADSQLTEGHQDNMPISEETPADQAKLDSLIQFLKERGSVLERDIVTLTYMKELHPSVDWRNVCSPASSIQIL